MKNQNRTILLYGAGFLLPVCLIFGYQSVQYNRYWLASDFEESDRICVVYSSQPYITELITTLSQYEAVGVLLQDKTDVEEAAIHLVKANKANIRYAVVPSVDQWIRDSGPGILKNGNGQLRAVNFFTRTSNSQTIANGLGLVNSNSEIPILGGARESNGEGLLMTTEQYFDIIKKGAWNKNSVEQKLREEYLVKQILWLKNGLIEDEIFDNGPIYEDIYPYGSGAHIDEFCRFINENTVLLAEVDPADLLKHPLYQVNHQRLEENYKRLQNWKNPKLQIVRVPATELLLDEMEHPEDQTKYKIVLPASYLNFVIGNKVVLAAKYHKPGLPESIRLKDERVQNILQANFPKHQVVQLDPSQLNRRGGGFHCVTLNLPTKKKRKRRWRWG